MRHRFAILLAVCAFLPLMAGAAPERPRGGDRPQSDAVYPLVLAGGALAGVAVVNLMTYGLGTLPLAIAAEGTAPVISPAAAAASRIFVVTSGVLGAWVADALYGMAQTPDAPAAGSP